MLVSKVSLTHASLIEIVHIMSTLLKGKCWHHYTSAGDIRTREPFSLLSSVPLGSLGFVKSSAHI